MLYMCIIVFSNYQICKQQYNIDLLMYETFSLFIRPLCWTFTRRSWSHAVNDSTVSETSLHQLTCNLSRKWRYGRVLLDEIDTHQLIRHANYPIKIWLLWWSWRYCLNTCKSLVHTRYKNGCGVVLHDAGIKIDHFGNINTLLFSCEFGTNMIWVSFSFLPGPPPITFTQIYL